MSLFLHHGNMKCSVLKEKQEKPSNAIVLDGRICMQYVWMNRQKATGESALTDPFCSLSWRLHPEMIHKLACNDKEKMLFSRLLDDDDQIYPSDAKEKRRFVTELFNDAFSRLQSFAEQIFTNGHTIGDKIAVGFRSTLLSAFKREHIPWDGASAIQSIQVMK